MQPEDNDLKSSTCIVNRETNMSHFKRYFTVEEMLGGKKKRKKKKVMKENNQIFSYAQQNNLKKSKNCERKNMTFQYFLLILLLKLRMMYIHLI